MTTATPSTTIQPHGTWCSIGENISVILSLLSPWEGEKTNSKNFLILKYLDMKVAGKSSYIHKSTQDFRIPILVLQQKQKPRHPLCFYLHSIAQKLISSHIGFFINLFCLHNHHLLEQLFMRLPANFQRTACSSAAEFCSILQFRVNCMQMQIEGFYIMTHTMILLSFHFEKGPCPCCLKFLI